MLSMLGCLIFQHGHGENDIHKREANTRRAALAAAARCAEAAQHFMMESGGSREKFKAFA